MTKGARGFAHDMLSGTILIKCYTYETSVIQVLYQSGILKCKSECSDVLVDVLERYLHLLATKIKSRTEQAGRSKQSIEDILVAFHELSIDPQTLGSFCKVWLPVEFPSKKPGSFPISIRDLPKKPKPSSVLPNGASSKETPVQDSSSVPNIDKPHDPNAPEIIIHIPLKRRKIDSIDETADVENDMTEMILGSTSLSFNNPVVQEIPTNTEEGVESLYQASSSAMDITPAVNLSTAISPPVIPGTVFPKDTTSAVNLQYTTSSSTMPNSVTSTDKASEIYLPSTILPSSIPNSPTSKNSISENLPSPKPVAAIEQPINPFLAAIKSKPKSSSTKSRFYIPSNKIQARDASLFTIQTVGNRGCIANSLDETLPFLSNYNSSAIPPTVLPPTPLNTTTNRNTTEKDFVKLTSPAPITSPIKNVSPKITSSPFPLPLEANRQVFETVKEKSPTLIVELPKLKFKFSVPTNSQ